MRYSDQEQRELDIASGLELDRLAAKRLNMSKTREQVVAQCRVVAHLARQIAVVHEQKAEAYASLNMSDGLIDVVGSETASFMEALGDILNGMDAVDEKEDRWVDPVFEAAHATWPQSP